MEENDYFFSFEFSNNKTSIFIKFIAEYRNNALNWFIEKTIQ